MWSEQWKTCVYTTKRLHGDADSDVNVCLSGHRQLLGSAVCGRHSSKCEEHGRMGTSRLTCSSCPCLFHSRKPPRSRRQPRSRSCSGTPPAAARNPRSVSSADSWRISTAALYQRVPGHPAGAEAGAEGDPRAAGPSVPVHELPEAGRRRACAAVLSRCR